MLKKQPLLLSINENKLQLSDINFINEKIFLSENFDITLNEKDLNLFYLILKLTDNNTYSMIDFIIKNSEKKYKEKKIEKKEETKIFIIKQILLLFVFISKNKENITSQKYLDLYKFMEKLYSSNFIQINDLIEIIRFNIIISMNDLINKYSIFITSIDFLVDLYISIIDQTTGNETDKENQLKPIYLLVTKLLESIYKNLLNNKDNLRFLKSYDRIEELALFNICIFYDDNSKENLLEYKSNLNDIIIKVLLLIYKNNYSKLINENILKTIKEGFFELKKGNDIKIKNIIRFLSNKMNLIHNIYIKEKDHKQLNDIYFPRHFFVFNESKDSGIDYNTELDLFNYNFVLIFSFKYSNNNNGSNYPLITFFSAEFDEDNNIEILLNISLNNKHLGIYIQKEFYELNEIELNDNETYLVAFEYHKNKNEKEKIKLTINNKDNSKKEIIFEPIKYKGKINLKIGYLREKLNSKYEALNNLSLNYYGIMGPILFFPDLRKDLEENIHEIGNDNTLLIANIYKLKGCYDAIIYMNNNYDIKNMLLYENDLNIKINYSFKKLDYFLISPLSMINPIFNNTNIFINDFNTTESISIIENFIKTKAIPSKYSNATYAKISFNTIQNFVKYDGMNLLTLLLEYFYNILKMLIDYNDNEKKLMIANEINKAIIPVFNLITEIISFGNINKFKNDLDTFGFSLMKTFSLLGDICPIKIDLINCLANNINALLETYYRKIEHNLSIGKVIKKFLNKLFVLISNPKYFDSNNTKEMKIIFQLFQNMLSDNNNKDMMNNNTLNSIIQFVFVLEHNNDEYKDEHLKELKLMKKEYKSLIELILKQKSEIPFYIEFLKILHQKNMSIKVKYKLLKIYYKTNISTSLMTFSNFRNINKTEEENSKHNLIHKNKKINDKIKKEQEKITKNEKYIILNSNFNLINSYINILNKILEKIISSSKKSQTSNIKYCELSKCIIIQLIFEQAMILSELYPEKKYHFFSQNNLLKSKEGIEIGINTDKNIFYKESTSEKHNISHKKRNTLYDSNKEISSISYIKESENVIILFDKLLGTNNISIYEIKTLFSCLFDEWDNISKMNFIKNEKDIKFENFKAIFGDFYKNKKELFSQILDILNFITNDNDKKCVINLIFHFLNRSIENYGSILNNKFIPTFTIKYYKKLYFHLFESKSLMNKIFEFALLNKNIFENDSILNKIIDICTNVLEYHPKPFIFSFLKELPKHKDINQYFSSIITGIIEFINISLKNDSNILEKEKNTLLNENEESNNTNIINSFLYFNEIKFIKCLMKIFQLNQIEMQSIFKENNSNFLNSLQNLLIAFFSSQLIFDRKLYIYNQQSLENIMNTSKTLINSNNKKNKEKNLSKLIQASQTKLLSTQISFLNLLEFTYIIIYILWTLPKDEGDLNKTKLINQFIRPIFDKINIEGHFISYYLDIFNSKKSEKSIKKANISSLISSYNFEEIPDKYQHWLEYNFDIRDYRLFSALAYLILLKYENQMISFEKQKENNNNNIQSIHDLFATNLYLFQIDICEVFKYFEKPKDKKILELILEKEESQMKDFKIQKVYYKALINFLSKNKIIKFENFEEFKTDINKKVLKEKDDSKKNSKIIEDSNSETSKEESSESNDKVNKENTLTENIIKKKRKDSFHKYYKDEDESTINSTSNKRHENDSNNINNNIDFKSKYFNIKLNITNSDKEDINFFYAKKPVLCTRRDLILKKFGYYFFDEYFRDERFIKLKNYFMQLYPPSELKNSYNKHYKQMKLNYPSVIKNFSNCINYFPRMILKPDSKFFNHRYLFKSHDYLKCGENIEDNNIYNYITSEENIKIMHFEYGHGLLNLDSFNLFTTSNTKENFSDSIKYIECEYINNKNTIQGKIKLIKNWIVFQTNKNFDFSIYERKINYRLSSRKDEIFQRDKQIIIPINLIQQIIYRNFLFYNQALEIFLYNGKSYFFNFYQFLLLEDFMLNLKLHYKNNNLTPPEIITNSIEYFHSKNYTNDWLENRISTLNYLLLVNKFSGRTYNDLTQYLILPWLLNDYSDITDSKNYRKMEYSMAIQDESKLEMIKKEFEKDKDLEKRSHFMYHYSNSANICLYLLRLNPFTYNQIKLNDHFDSPDRQIESMQEMCDVFKEFKETSELVPEYFFMVECFLNLNFNFFGFRKIDDSGRTLVNNIKLNLDFMSYLELIMFHKNFINSEIVSGNINKWIDNIFGENQLTDKKNVVNTYPYDCYQKHVREDVDAVIEELNEYNPTSEQYMEKEKAAIKKIRGITDYAYFFGQCPSQVFQKAHPVKSAEYFYKNIKNNEKDYLETKLSTDDLLYLSYRNNNKNLYVLSNNDIFIYNKNFNLVQNFSIKKFEPILISNINLTSENKTFFSNFFAKNFIFDIEDCKIFFIGGYLDNSLKIYYPKNNKVLTLSIMLESRITCMCNIPSEHKFLTGHENGKIIKWKYSLIKNNNNSKEINDINSIISVKSISRIIGHKSAVKKIEVNEELNIIISSSNDGYILIRKLYDFELLNIISYNNDNKYLLDLCFISQIIIATFYNIKEINEPNQKVIINAYSLNGIKLSKISKNIRVPFAIKDTNDKLLVFIKNSLYEVNLTFYTWDLKIDLENSIINNGNENKIISYVYDSRQRNIFCLYEDGKLLRKNIQD